MSDNLKVAKECGATELGDQSYYTGLEWKDCPRLVFSGDVLEAYTSRILASQQAAHEAEIAKWIALSQANEQVAALAQKRADKAESVCAMKDEALRVSIPYLDNWADKSMKQLAEGAISATPQQVSERESKQIAEAEQRGAVKAHQEYMVIGVLHKDRFYAFPPFPEGSKLLFDRATSKKAG